MRQWASEHRTKTHSKSFFAKRVRRSERKAAIFSPLLSRFLRIPPSTLETLIQRYFTINGREKEQISLPIFFFNEWIRDVNNSLPPPTQTTTTAKTTSDSRLEQLTIIICLTNGYQQQAPIHTRALIGSPEAARIYISIAVKKRVKKSTVENVPGIEHCLPLCAGFCVGTEFFSLLIGASASDGR